MYLYVNRIKSLIKVVWTIFIVGILATAYFNNDHKQYFNCKTIYVPINAKKDRQFTYEDIGAFALQITALPQKLLSNSSELKLLIDFLELKPNECAAPKGIMVSGTLFLILCLVAGLLASFAFFGFRFFVK
jgi:hypothetical protein